MTAVEFPRMPPEVQRAHDLVLSCPSCTRLRAAAFAIGELRYYGDIAPQTADQEVVSIEDWISIAHDQHTRDVHRLWWLWCTAPDADRRASR